MHWYRYLFVLVFAAMYRPVYTQMLAGTALSLHHSNFLGHGKSTTYRQEFGWIYFFSAHHGLFCRLEAGIQHYEPLQPAEGIETSGFQLGGIVGYRLQKELMDPIYIAGTLGVRMLKEEQKFQWTEWPSGYRENDLKWSGLLQAELAIYVHPRLMVQIPFIYLEGGKSGMEPGSGWFVLSGPWENPYFGLYFKLF